MRSLAPIALNKEGLEMEIMFFGHACLKIHQADKLAVLMDPWFSPSGAFFGSWFQFPENTILTNEAISNVNDICISHNHADHFDPPLLLKALAENRSLSVHIPAYQTTWFARLARRLLPGCELKRITEHPPFQEFTVSKSDMRVFFVPEESPGEVDSAIVCYDSSTTVVNLNDARLSADRLARIRNIITSVDFLCLQASGASEYPICYTYPPDDMDVRCLQKRADKLEDCKRTIDILRPHRVFFFAGPPVFLDSTLARFNDRKDNSVFPDQLDILCEIQRSRADIAAKSLFLLPGEKFDDAHLWSEIDLESERLIPYTRKSEYIEAYRQRRQEFCSLELVEPPDDNILMAYFGTMPALSEYISTCIGGALTFTIKGATSETVITVDFSTGTTHKGTVANPLYTLTIPASSLVAVLAGRATWDDIFLSLRMQFDEQAERFVPHYKTLLRYMDSELFDRIELYERGINADNDGMEMMEVDLCDGKVWIQRFCPHAGADFLYNGRVNADGTITCLSHRLSFDLRTGRCVNGRTYQLRVNSQHRRALSSSKTGPS
jgi:UDP-MurNAc hydroxylase